MDTIIVSSWSWYHLTTSIMITTRAHLFDGYHHSLIIVSPYIMIIRPRHNSPLWWISKDTEELTWGSLRVSVRRKQLLHSPVCNNSIWCLGKYMNMAWSTITQYTWAKSILRCALLYSYSFPVKSSINGVPRLLKGDDNETISSSMTGTSYFVR